MMMGSVLTMFARLRSLYSIVFALMVAFVLLGESASGNTKEFEVDGSIDCDARSGRECPPLRDDLLGVRSDDVTGELTTVKIDVAWVLRDLPPLRQDRAVCLVVRDEGTMLRAVGVPDICDELGTVNPGASSRNRTIAEQPKHLDEDDDPVQATPTPTIDLTAEKAESDDPVDNGDVVEYTLTARNVGAALVAPLVIEDRLTLPLPFVNVLVSIPDFGDFDTCFVTLLNVPPPPDPAEVEFRCTRAAGLAPGAAASMDYTVEVFHGNDEPYTASDEVLVDPDNQHAESNENNNDDSEDTTWLDSVIRPLLSARETSVDCDARQTRRGSSIALEMRCEPDD